MHRKCSFVGIIVALAATAAPVVDHADASSTELQINQADSTIAADATTASGRLDTLGNVAPHIRIGAEIFLDPSHTHGEIQRHLARNIKRLDCPWPECSSSGTT